MSYFVLVIMIASVICYGEGLANASHEVDGSKLRYIDALFLCTSAMTTTGLNTVNLGDLTSFQQSIMLVLMSIGNVIFVSMFTVVVRLYFFRRKLADLVEHTKLGRDVAKDIERQDSRRSGEKVGFAERGSDESTTSGLRKRTAPRKQLQTVPSQESAQTPPPPYSAHQTGFGSFPWPWELPQFRDRRDRYQKGVREHDPKRYDYLSFDPSLDDRGRIVGLSEHQRVEVGGIEYRALKLLIWLLVFYQLFWIILGALFYIPYAYRSGIQQIIRTSQAGDLNPGWWGYFAASTVSNISGIGSECH